MNLRSRLASTILLVSIAAAGSGYAQNADVRQNVTLDEKLRIPGASLKPGTYTFSIEDRLQDRAIVRITSQDQSKHFLVLTVPSAKLGQPGSDTLIRFTTSHGKDQVLRGWACPSCTPGLEFVYPKAEAAKLTDDTAEPILAVDPSFDKLPANLSPDDMKVVTLWLLSPERITASKKGKGVKAEKYASVSSLASANAQTASANSSEVAQAPAPTSPAPIAQVTKPAASLAPSASGSTSELAPVPTLAPSPTQAVAASQALDVASTSSAPPVNTGRTSGRLPKTASSDYLYLVCGMLLITGGLGIRLYRRASA